MLQPLDSWTVVRAVNLPFISHVILITVLKAFLMDVNLAMLMEPSNEPLVCRCSPHVLVVWPLRLDFLATFAPHIARPRLLIASRLHGGKLVMVSLLRNVTWWWSWRVVSQYGVANILYIWVNYNDLKATSLESWLVREIIPKWP